MHKERVTYKTVGQKVELATTACTSKKAFAVIEYSLQTCCTVSGYDCRFGFARVTEHGNNETYTALSRYQARTLFSDIARADSRGVLHPSRFIVAHFGWICRFPIYHLIDGAHQNFGWEISAKCHKMPPPEFASR